jgi:hypothetical protein
MADFIHKSQVILIGGYDFSGRLNACALDYGAELRDNTAFGDVARSRIAGLKNAAIAVEGYADETVYNPAAFAMIGASMFPVSVLNGPAIGDQAYGFEAVAGSFPLLEGGIGDMARFALQAEGGDGSPGIFSGKVLNNQNRTGSGNGTEVQLGAVAAGQRLYACLHVLSVGGSTPTLDLKIQSDATGFASPTDRITFGQKNAIGYDFQSVAGPVTDDFWRVSWVIGGTGSPNFTFAVAAGII